MAKKSKKRTSDDVNQSSSNAQNKSKSGQMCASNAKNSTEENCRPS